MKRLTYSFPAKVAAVFALVASALLTGACGIVVIVAYSANFYRLRGDVWDYQSALEYLVTGGWLGTNTRDFFFMGEQRPFYELVFNARYSGMLLCAFGLVAFILLFIFLMCAAGRRGDREGVTLSFFDKVPFDLVLTAAGFAEICLFVAELELGNAWFRDDPTIWFVFAAAVAAVMVLLLLLTCSTFAARVKAGRWYRNTVIYMVLHRVFVWVRAVFRWLRRLFRAIRYEWRVALGSLGLFFLCFIGLISTVNHQIELGFILFMGTWGVSFAVTVFSAFQFRRLRSAGAKLAAGELDHKVNTEKMYFDFRLMGEDLNSIGDGMSAAVEQRMKSERLKTELITNVSHDIKTPLTSIVNYVDLLQKEHTDEEEAQYLDVLKRQSDKLRRLTVDLVEASKASTGNLTTEMVPVNTDELINQAVAEYADKFALGQLEPVITLPEKPITVFADGRHLWRVLDNLFNNTVKYAQPGTRVYIDARRLDGEALISVKNISRDRLNVSSDELMERFVRGDASRHTEGSGLGLSIARSLTELMGGRFDISIDGDLFKAEIHLKLL